MKLSTAAALALSIASTGLPAITGSWSTLCYAVDADAQDVLTVNASGTGVDEDKALRQALKNAVMQAVGTIVDAETILKNDDIIKDQVLTASNAIVTKVERIGKPRVEDGLVTVQIRAQVEKRGLMAKLQDTKVVAVAKVDGKVEFAKMVANLENEKDVSKVIEKCLEGFPVNVMKAEIVGKPEIAGKRGDKVVLRYTVEYSLDREKYAEWRKAVEPVFSALKKPEKIQLSPANELYVHNKKNFDNVYNKNIDIPYPDSLILGKFSRDGVALNPLQSDEYGYGTVLIYQPESKSFNSYSFPLAAISGICSSSLQVPLCHAELFSDGKLAQTGANIGLLKGGVLFYPLIPPNILGLYDNAHSAPWGYIPLSSLKHSGVSGKEKCEKTISDIEKHSTNIDTIDSMAKMKPFFKHQSQTCLKIGLMGSHISGQALFEKVKVKKELEVLEKDAKGNLEIKEILTLHSPLAGKADEAITTFIQ